MEFCLPRWIFSIVFSAFLVNYWRDRERTTRRKDWEHSFAASCCHYLIRSTFIKIQFIEIRSTFQLEICDLPEKTNWVCNKWRIEGRGKQHFLVHFHVRAHVCYPYSTLKRSVLLWPWICDISIKLFNG